MEREEKSVPPTPKSAQPFGSNFFPASPPSVSVPSNTRNFAEMHLLKVTLLDTSRMPRRSEANPSIRLGFAQRFWLYFSRYSFNSIHPESGSRFPAGRGSSADWRKGRGWTANSTAPPASPCSRAHSSAGGRSS